MENRIAVIGIIVEDTENAKDVNSILHNFGHVIVGRMGIPYRERGLSIMSIIVDGSMDDINSMTGKLGNVKSVSVKAAISKK